MWWFPIASMSETTKGTCSSWGYICCLYSAPLYHRGDLLTMPLPTWILYHKKRPLQRGVVFWFSRIYTWIPVEKLTLMQSNMHQGFIQFHWSRFINMYTLQQITSHQMMVEILERTHLLMLQSLLVL